jgi:3-oxoadipate enol-lactonase
MPHFLTDDGVRLVYDDGGPRDGIPVVLCHSFTAAGGQLAADAAFLAARGYRVLVPDLRGHGRSGTPRPMRPEGFSIARMAHDLVGMLDHANVGPVHWVGNSLGGILGLELLGKHEARLKTLATFGTPYVLSLPRWSAYAIPLSYAAFGRKLHARMAARAMARGEPARRLIADLVERFDPDVGRLIGHNLARFDYRSVAATARLPILLLRGGRDPQINITLGSTLKLLRPRRNFTLVDLAAGGHCANLDATDRFRTALLEFWESSQL